MDSLCGCYISRVLPRFGEYDTLREEVDWIHEFLFSGEGQSLHDTLERLYRYFAEGESIAKFRIRNTLPMRNKCIDVISILAEHIASFVVDESRLITTILAKRQTISEFQKNNKLFVNLESIQQCAIPPFLPSCRYSRFQRPPFAPYTEGIKSLLNAGATFLPSSLPSFLHIVLPSFT